MKKFNFSKGLVIGLLTLALCLTCFGVAKVSADDAVVKPTPVSATYVPATDSISVGANNVVYVLKQEKGNTIKAGSKCYTTAGTVEDTLTAIGAKSTTKAVYLYVCNKEFEEQADNINANLVIKPQAAKKVTISVDYTKADNGAADNVLTIVATDSNGKEITGLTAANIYWYDAETDTWKAGNLFTGAMLKTALENGGLTLQAKMLGTASPAVRTSKEVKVKISAPGKAPKIKLDVKKDVISLKNGMDFGFATGDADNPVAPATWYTILPVLKDAKTAKMEESIVPTANYLPLDKKAKAAKNAATYDSNGIVSTSTVSYTKYKFKNVMLSTLLTTIGKKTVFENGTDVFVAVRTSATNKKPASEISYITIKGQTEAPIVITEDKVKGQKVVASGDFASKGISGVVVNAYPGTKEVNSTTVLATTGFWNTFVVDENGTGADANTPSFEFAVVKKADLDNGNIDWSTVAWKKFTDKTKISAKLSTKYALVGKSVTQVALKAGSVVSSDINSSDTLNGATTYLLIRRAGVKGGTVDASVSASKYIKLFVVKDGKDYKLVSEKDIGDEAKKYTVEFYKYAKNANDDNYAFNKDSKTASIIGWATASSNVTNVELPAIENAEFDIDKPAAHATGTAIADGKISFTMGSDDTLIKVGIKEYANITITAKYTPSGLTGDDLTAYNTAIATYATDRLIVENGVISAPSSGTVRINGDDVTYTTKVFVGDEIVIPAATLSGYTFTGPATAPSGVTEATGVYKVKPLSAKEVKATINYTVTKAAE